MIEGMGDKAAAKDTMKKAGVPTIPGSDGLIDDFAHCKKLAEEIGYPVMLKATAGGGGRGMRLVWKEETLEAAWDSARQSQLQPSETMECTWRNSLKILAISKSKLLEIVGKSMSSF